LVHGGDKHRGALVTSLLLEHVDGFLIEADAADRLLLGLKGTMGKEVAFRADAAFAKPEIYEALEERGVKYAIRIPADDSLERDIAELLTRPVGRPRHKPVV